MLSPEQQRRDTAAKALAKRDTQLAEFSPGLVESGTVAGVGQVAGQIGMRGHIPADSGGPRLLFDLEMLCHKTGCKVPLTAILYTYFITQEGRVMLWIEGVCPKCMETRKTIFDPMVGQAGRMKQRAELDAQWEQWRNELTPDEPDDAEEVGVRERTA